MMEDLPLWMADIYYSRQLPFMASTGTSSQMLLSTFDENTPFPNIFIGNENTPEFRQHI